MKQNISFEQMPAVLSELTEKIDSMHDALSKIASSQEADQERLISASEACKLFVPSISRLTLIRWTKANYLHEHRIGGRVFYKRSEIFDAAQHVRKYRSLKHFAKSIK